jgi:hypothetical protein
MREFANSLVGVIIVLSRIAVCFYVLWYLMGCVITPENFNINKMTPFIYFFIWEIWVNMSTNKYKINDDDQNVE